MKWPGGKTSELPVIRPLIPAFDRYVEPFAGGGAMFFDLEPASTLLSDVSPTLTWVYRHITSDTAALSRCLNEICDAREAVAAFADGVVDDLTRDRHRLASADRRETVARTAEWFSERRRMTDGLGAATGPYGAVAGILPLSVADKLYRIGRHEMRTGAWPTTSVRDQIVTGCHAALFLAIRRSAPRAGSPRASAEFVYQREFAYGGMFRFNGAGTFNVPYGGRSYNDKPFRSKAQRFADPDVVSLMARTDIRCGDFQPLLAECGAGDFVFLDPPYDSAFTAYDGFTFGPDDQCRLATALTGADFTFLAVVGRSPLTAALYDDVATADQSISVIEYEKTYRYNVRGRNARDAVHLLVRNY